MVEVYIDDIVVKSRTRGEHDQHLEEFFHLLRKYNMKLNPSKCAFRVSAGKFLGFMVTQRGIEVNPDQIRVVMETSVQSNKKELQHLIGRLVALRRFIARFIDKLRPFFLMLKGVGTLGWTEDCQSAFEVIKHYLTQPPILSSPQPDKQLYMYLTVFTWAVSVVLFRCISDKEQRLVYYINKAMVDAETRYSKMEQTTLALRSAAQKLRPYFQAHPIVVLTNQPFRKPSKEEWCTLHIDKASRTSRSEIGLLLQSPTREQLEQTIRLGFPASNNEAKYEAILSRLNLTLALSASKLEIYSDSQLVVRHVQGEYEAKDGRMTQYLTKVQDTLNQLNKWAIKRIPRTENSTFSIAVTPLYSAREENIKWTREIENYLRIGDLPEERKHAHKVRMQAAHFTLIRDRLYKRSFRGPFLRCLDSTEAQYVLAELHEGICNNHTGERSLAHRAHS
ncbi:uncharacterized protein LOC117921772 [Vitis riparia]|uniref:uncharacterized protein LOC117921772 n=1 Tax=Vitis riparia TaxID=96939 RepID=UPI00155A76A6|nr:uncharacterized protein LOC117921772 [Vitis riparia]